MASCKTPQGILIEAVAKHSGSRHSVTVCSGVRLKFAIDNHHGFGDIAPLYLWSNIEPDIAVICACLPVMMPLVKFIGEKLGPLVKLIGEKLGSEISLPYFYSTTFGPSKSQRSHSRDYESAQNTDRDDFTHLVDGAELSKATSWAWRGSLSGGGTAKSAEEGLAMDKVHVRNDRDVSHDHTSAQSELSF